jgi:hypothetical protein
MAGQTSYFVVKYDNESGGPFVAESTTLLTWTASTGFVVTVIDRGTTGKLVVALLTGTIPTDGLTLTQGGVTADADGDGAAILYPAFFRSDITVPSTGIMVWDGLALGATHSFLFDGQTSNVVVDEILTFVDGQQCQVVTILSDVGASGELAVRWISNIDTQGYPEDNDTFTGDIAGDGTLNMLVHDRCYTPLHLHRLLSDLNDDEDIAGDDDLSRIDPTPSGKATDQIVDLLSTMVINDTIAQHMYGGSVSQDSGDALYSGLNVQVTSPDSDTRPVLIQYNQATGTDAIITDYWKNAFMPHSIDGQVRILRLTRDDGVDIDGKRVRGGLMKFNYNYFFGGTTLGTATTALALFTSSDGNNQTAEGTVAGAPYNTIVQTEGYQTIDYNNGNGATPFGYEVDFGSANSLQTYERTKWIQREDSSENLFSRAAQLFTGINLDFAYDNEQNGPFVEDEIIAWGTEIAYSGQTTNCDVGEVITFSPSGAKGRLLHQQDAGATGTLIIALEGTVQPTGSDTLTGVSSGGDGDVDTVVSNTAAGRAVLVALYDNGVDGNLYCQLITGLVPADDQEVWGAGTTYASVNEATGVNTRTVNNQYMGVYTGTNYQTNFGIAIDNTDAIVGDKLTNLLDVVQEPPNNQQGTVDGLEIDDAVTCYPWDGTSYDSNGDAEPDFDEQSLNATLTQGVSTVVDVGTGNIPDNTPQTGFLRIEDDSDNNMRLVEYDSHDSDDEYQIVGTAPFTATAGNDVMRALIDEVVTSGTSLSYTAVKGAGSTQVTIQVRNGGTLNGPIKPYPTTATFGTTGFLVSASRITDA